MKAWITRWALTGGIFEVERDDDHDTPLVAVAGCEYVHATKEEAVAKAEQMRADEIESLEERLAKLERMVF